jgi:hypothetical protein
VVYADAVYSAHGAERRRNAVMALQAKIKDITIAGSLGWVVKAASAFGAFG